MNDNTAIVYGIAVVCLLLGSVTWAVHVSSVQGATHSHDQATQHEANQQAMRIECLKLGRTWIPDMCLPKECPK